MVSGDHLNSPSERVQAPAWEGLLGIKQHWNGFILLQQRCLLLDVAEHLEGQGLVTGLSEEVGAVQEEGERHRTSAGSHEIEQTSGTI